MSIRRAGCEFLRIYTKNLIKTDSARNYSVYEKLLRIIVNKLIPICPLYLNLPLMEITRLFSECFM